MNLKKVANGNIHLKNLYKEIGEWKTIESAKGDGDEWGSHINENGNAVITHVKTKNKLSSLAHELLHFKIQKNGYKRLRSIILPPEYRSCGKRILTALDNELQHHRMYDEFIQMNFLKKDFYCDTDKNIKNHIESIISNNTTALIDLIPDYLTVIAPGGGLTDKEKQDYKEQFKRKTNSDNEFYLIDSLFESWKTSGNYNCENMVRSIFEFIGDTDFFWIGYNDGSEFPNSGFFLGDIFTMKQYHSEYPDS